MKITKSQLKQIIKEELTKVLRLREEVSPFMTKDRRDVQAIVYLFNDALSRKVRADQIDKWLFIEDGHFGDISEDEAERLAELYEALFDLNKEIDIKTIGEKVIAALGG